jgi:hypothetical protein
MALGWEASYRKSRPQLAVFFCVHGRCHNVPRMGLMRRHTPRLRKEEKYDAYHR